MNQTGQTLTKTKNVYDDDDGYIWNTVLTYPTDEMSDADIEYANTVSKLMFDTFKMYYNRPPTHIDTSVVREGQDNHMRVTVDMREKRRWMDTGFTLSDFRGCFEESFNNHCGTDLCRLDYCNRARYEWTIKELNTGSYTNFRLVVEFVA